MQKLLDLFPDLVRWADRLPLPPRSQSGPACPNRGGGRDGELLLRSAQSSLAECFHDGLHNPFVDVTVDAADCARQSRAKEFTKSVGREIAAPEARPFS